MYSKVVKDSCMVETTPQKNSQVRLHLNLVRKEEQPFKNTVRDINLVLVTRAHFLTIFLQFKANLCYMAIEIFQHP